MRISDWSSDVCSSDLDQMLDRGDRGVGHDAMAEVEDMGTIGERRKDAVDRRIERAAPRDERERIEIALDRKMRRQGGVGPGRIDRLVDPDRIDAGLIGIGAQLAPGALRKADDRRFELRRTSGRERVWPYV